MVSIINPSDTAGREYTPLSKHLERSSPVKMAKKKAIKYKKAPQAPRRFKSSYMFFSTCKHKEIRKELGSRGAKEKTTNIAKLVSVAWKELSPEKRKPWEELARQDKARFEVEKSLYTGPWKVIKKKRLQRDPNAPKRPMSAFLAYSHGRRAEVKKENANMNNAAISRALASMWKGAPEDEKKEHIDKEYKLRQKYLTEIAIWRENTEKELNEQRRNREEIAMETVLQAKDGTAAAIQEEEVAQQQNRTNEKEEGAESQEGAYPGSYPPPHHYRGGLAQDYRAPHYIYSPRTPHYQSSLLHQHHQLQQPRYGQQQALLPFESQKQEACQNDEYYQYHPPAYGYCPPLPNTPTYQPPSASGDRHYPVESSAAAAAACCVSNREKSMQPLYYY